MLNLGENNVYFMISSDLANGNWLNRNLVYLVDTGNGCSPRLVIFY